MSYEEKGTWVFLVVSVATYAAYLSIILGRAEGIPLAEVPYVATMLWAIGAAVALSIVGRIVIEIAAHVGIEVDRAKELGGGVAREEPSETIVDVRDKHINRFGEYVGGVVLGVGMLAPFGLALAEFAHFWIANAMYAVFILSAIVSSIVKIVAYRRGL